MSSPLWKFPAIAIAGVHVVSGNCNAQETGSAEWFRQVWAEASNWKPDQPLHIRVVSHHEFFVEEAEVAALRAKVGNSKSGRDYSILQRMEWERAHPAIDWTTDIATDGDRFRYAASDVADRNGLQFALGRNTDWLIENGMLRIAPRDIEDAQYGVRNYINTADQIVRMVIWAGLGTAPGGQNAPGAVRLSTAGWEGEALGADGKPVSLLQGRVAQSGSPSIRGMTIERSMLANPAWRDSVPLGRCEYAGWTTDETVGRFIVNELNWTDAKGRTVQTTRLEFLRPISVQEFERLLAVPSEGGVDAWGHSADFQSVQDLRPGHLAQKSRDNGSWVDVPLSIPVVEMSWKDRWYAWLVPVALAGVGVGLAWRLRHVGRGSQP